MIALARTVLAISLLCSTSSFQERNESTVRFELRLADRDPHSGLTEAIVENTKEKIYLHKEAIVTNRDVVEARIVRGYIRGRYDIEITFTTEGAERMAKATRGHVGRPVAILLDGKVLSAPVVRSKLKAVGLISGEFERREAERIVKGITSR